MTDIIPFITTYSMLRVNPLALRVEDIRVRDIAHHLALTNRWVGASRWPINVAHHSLCVSRLLDGTGWELEGLMHDATEAYLGDVSRWVKRHPAMAFYRGLENDAWLVICKALALRPELPEIVKQDDALMVRLEALRGLGRGCHLFQQPTHPIPTDAEIARVGRWSPLHWQRSEEEFLERYARLRRREALPFVGENSA